MQLLNKKCPACQGRITFFRFMKITSRTFACEKCGVQLEAGKMWVQMSGMALGTFFISEPIMRTRHNPLWWWALIPGFFLFLFWSYLFVAPRRVRSL